MGQEEMPPMPPHDGVTPEYHITQMVIAKSMSLAKAGYDNAKPYTPSRVQTLLNNKIEQASAVVEPYKERASELVDRLDARLDSAVIAPAVSVCQEASHRADHIRSNTGKAADSVRHHMGFVGSSITESCGEQPSEDVPPAPATILQKAQSKVSTLKSFVSTKYSQATDLPSEFSNTYYKVLEHADHGIEVWLPETDESAAPEQKAAGPFSLAMKAAKRLRPTAAKQLQASKARTAEQL